MFLFANENHIPTMEEDEQTSRLDGGFCMFHEKHWSAKIQLLIVIVVGGDTNYLRLS